MHVCVCVKVTPLHKVNLLNVTCQLMFSEAGKKEGKEALRSPGAGGLAEPQSLCGGGLMVPTPGDLTALDGVAPPGAPLFRFRFLFLPL